MLNSHTCTSSKMLWVLPEGKSETSCAGSYIPSCKCILEYKSSVVTLSSLEWFSRYSSIWVVGGALNITQHIVWTCLASCVMHHVWEEPKDIYVALIWTCYLHITTLLNSIEDTMSWELYYYTTTSFLEQT